MKDGVNNEQLVELGREDVYKNIEVAILKYAKEKAEESRTAKLWFLY